MRSWGRSCCLLFVTPLLMAGLAGAAQAAPVTLDFESGAAPGALVTNQYGPPGTAAGPTFMTAAEDGLKGVECGAPHLSSSFKAHSGSRELKLDGCEGGEFWRSDTFFSLGYSTERVEYYVASNTPKGSTTVTSTAFNAAGTLLSQQETTIPAASEPLYEPVVLESLTGEIAAVAVQLGRNFHTEPTSSTGVSEGAGNTDVLLDDLTYYPPASPPESSFRLGASPAAVATSEGNEVTVKIPVTWTNNPNPSGSPVELEAITPKGVKASFSENPTSSGSSTMTLKIAKGSGAFSGAVTVNGYVGKGTVSEKTSSVAVPLSISPAVELTGVEPLTLAPCTPGVLHLHALVPSYVTEPVSFFVDAGNQPAVSIAEISGGHVSSGSQAETTVATTPAVGGREATATVTFSTAAGAKPAGPAAYAVSALTGEYAEVTHFNNMAVEAGQVDRAVYPKSTVAETSVSTPALHQLASQVEPRRARLLSRHQGRGGRWHGRQRNRKPGNTGIDRAGRNLCDLPGASRSAQRPGRSRPAQRRLLPGSAPGSARLPQHLRLQLEKSRLRPAP